MGVLRLAFQQSECLVGHKLTAGDQDSLRQSHRSAACRRHGNTISPTAAANAVDERAASQINVQESPSA
jgi:hypothetical protein